MYPCCCNQDSSGSLSSSPGDGSTTTTDSSTPDGSLTSFPTITSCAGGVEIAECWEVVIAGVTDNNCTDCDENLNGVFLLDNPNNNNFFTCTFTYDFSPAWCLGNGTTITLTYSTLQTNVTLSMPTAFGGPIINYEIARSSFNELGSNVMSLNTSSTACSDLPSTVTVSPASCT